MSNLSVIGLQWGDEGKGKIVDYLSEYVDAVVRFQGGNNAGHTIVTGNDTYKLNLLPSGIIRGDLFSIIDQGVVLDPYALLDEINHLTCSVTTENLMISENCHLICSWHKELDSLYEKWRGDNSIGTTGKGIGPCYEDKVARRGLRICDIYDRVELSHKLDSLLEYHNSIRRSNSMIELVKSDIMEEINEIADILQPYVVTYDRLMSIYSTSRILLEGAQGALLDISYGTYPFVTSSSTISVGHHENYVLGVLKAYTTRVGSGVFPTEQENDLGERLQKVGKEVGTVSGRRRRCGWFDSVLINYAINITQTQSLALTKLDVLDGMDVVKICTHYQYKGKRYDYLPSNYQIQRELEPVYQEFPGWKESTAGITDYHALPENAKVYISAVEDLVQRPVVMVSTGPRRQDTIMIDE